MDLLGIVSSDFKASHSISLQNSECGKYSLVTNVSQPSFDNISNLCQYYTNHQLSRSVLRDDLSKESVENLCFKWPYTYYLNHSNEF